jgi:FkbM family methyltransferase
MPGIVSTILSSPLGRMIYLPVKKAVHLARKLAHPGVPLDHTIRMVKFRDRRFRMEIRRWSDSDNMALDQCFVQQQYEIPSGGAHRKYLDELYASAIGAGKKPLIVDCGANIGASVLWMGLRYPEAHIVAIEPAADNFELLVTNCSGLDAEFIEAAIGPDDGTAFLDDPGGGGMGYRTSSSGAGSSVRIVSLATVMANKPDALYMPFLLKVDIEGAERKLFAAHSDLLNSFPLIVMEPHDWMFPGELTSEGFFRFHTQMHREFAMIQENVASIRRIGMASPANTAELMADIAAIR